MAVGMSIDVGAGARELADPARRVSVVVAAEGSASSDAVPASPAAREAIRARRPARPGGRVRLRAVTAGGGLGFLDAEQSSLALGAGGADHAARPRSP